MVRPRHPKHLLYVARFSSPSLRCLFAVRQYSKRELRFLVGGSMTNRHCQGRPVSRTIKSSRSDHYKNLRRYKITPVTLPNIQPVKLNDNGRNPSVGQNLTIVGYKEFLMGNASLRGSGGPNGRACNV